MPPLWLIIANTVLVVVVMVASGGYAWNAGMSSWYSPERAVTDYFGAQSRGDVAGMMSTATFLPGSNPEFFDRFAVSSMMYLGQNKDIHDVKVLSSRTLDPLTRSVAVSMTWSGIRHEQTYTVRQDTSQVHGLFYHSWRIVIPLVTIHVTLPVQPAWIEVDGVYPATPTGTTIQAIEGYHVVTMEGNFLYDSASLVVNGVGEEATAAFTPGISSGTLTLAAAAVKSAFGTCDSTKYKGCLDHTYRAPNDGYLYYFTLPGYGDVYFNTYRLSLVGDPTTGMKVTIPKDAGKLNASGACTVSMSIDGRRSYRLSGTWTAVLTWDDGFIGDVITDCSGAKA